MSRSALYIEHKRVGGKSARHLRIPSERKLFIIGSSADADLRIAGENVQGCHAVLQFRAPHWYLRSLALDAAPVTIDGEAVVETAIDKATSISIGEHQLTLLSKTRTVPLFRDQPETEASAEPMAPTGELSMHQIVITKNGTIAQTVLLERSESFRLFDGEKTVALPPPTTGEWIETAVGARTVRQRLVSRQEIAATAGMGLDKDLRRPVGAALLLMALVLGLAFLLPKPEDKPELALDQKSIDMIFNAEMIKKKRLEAKTITQSAKMRSGGTQSAAADTNPIAMPDVSRAPVKSEKATAALNSIRNAGLASLIGKIAKRANKNGPLIAATGVSPDVPNSGRALFSNGKATTGGGGTAAVAGESYRLGGIATKGKGGGATGIREGTALSGGTVGTGDVAMVDEETVIEGGLDRDVIADVIRRNLGQIRYCYERQLSSNPELYGKLLVRFTIDAAGGVMEPKIDTSTLKSNMVEGCVLRRLAGWKFPNPKGGTQVRVSYPFLFKALD